MRRIKSFVVSSAAILGLLAPAPVFAACDDLCAGETAETSGPALWKVADEDTTIYLFGTVHVLPDGTQWYGPTIDAALESSSTLVSELGPMGEWQGEFQREMAAKGTLPEGTTLRSLMTAEQQTAYEATLMQIGLPVDAFDKNEPWVANISLAVIPLLQQGYKLDQGVEHILEREAGPDIARGALETPADQVGIWDGFTMEQQVDQLMDTLEMLPELKTFIDSMVAEWVEGDPDGLGEILNEPMDEDPAVAAALLYDRNARWAVWIDDRLDQPGTVFIAVGAGHLAGKNSVQQYLAARGIRSMRIQ